MSDELAQPDEFEELLAYLKGSRGFDFTAYKRSSLVRRVQKRMQAAQIEAYAEYCDYLEAHPQEFTQLFNAVLINVTSFFRDPQMWDYLRCDLIPRILDIRRDSAIRVWSAGCSSGEEAYSLTMLLAEALGHEQFRERVRIYATDVDEEALNQGRLASYSEYDVAKVPQPFRSKFFEHSNGRYVFDRDLRRSVIFGRHDLILDPPISRITLLVCRNALMYFNAEVQQRVLDRFHSGLHDGGFLFLGKAEMLLTRSNAFVPVDLRKRIFAKVFRSQLRNGVGNAGPQADGSRNDQMALDRLQDLSLQSDPTSQIVIDPSRTIAFLNDRVRTLFGLSANDVGRPFQDLELSYRPTELRSIVEQAFGERRARTVKAVEWVTPAGERIFLEVQVMPLLDALLEVVGVRILFRDVTRHRKLEDDLKISHQELETANEELQSTNEELETTNEELQSTVEELETTNEELQSTNEELETMNEELQSTNEELQTANEQLHHSGNELNRVNAFLENVLGSVHSGVIVVDGELRVQAWNHRAEDLWGLRSSEVQGRHLMNLDIGLPVDRLRQPLRQCLSGESPFVRVELAATNRRGKTIALEVACAPFALAANPTWGVILTMEELESGRSSAN